MDRPQPRTVHLPRPGADRLTAQTLWRIPRVGSLAASPDGTAVAAAVTTYDAEKNEGAGRIWLVPADGGEGRPLTAAGASCGSPRFAPDGRRLAYTRKEAGGKPQLYILPLDGGESERLTDLPLGIFDPHWLPDGRAVVFGTTLLRGHLTVEATRAELERRAKDPVKAHVTEERFYRYWDTFLTTGEVQHLFALDLGSGTLADLTPDAVTWFDWLDPSGQLDVSPDGREVAYSAAFVERERDLVRSAIFTVALDGAQAAGAVRCLTAGNPADDTRPRYTPDGRSILYGMQHDPFFYADRVRLMAYRRSSARHEPVLADWHLSPSSWEIAPDGTVLLLAEDHARVALFALRERTPELVLSGGSLGSLAPTSGHRAFVTLDTMSDPAEVHVVEDGAARRLSRFTQAALAGIALGEVQEWHVQGAAGETVQMWLVLPPGHAPGARHPLVHVIHGGPHGISGDDFHYRWNAHLFAAPGHAVAVVNFQGSTSFGQDFAQRIQGAWAERPFEDIMKATDALVAAGIADPDRMAACGASYGGYMAAWIAGHTDRFRCIVNHAGVFDTLTQYASDVTQGRAQAFGGEPWKDLPLLDRTNPARFSDGFKTPMLVAHGALDYRVPADQGLECYGILKAKGIPARLVYFPDENHWVLKPKNSLLWYGEVLAWLARWLGPAA